MKAILMTAAGDPDVLQLREVPTPQIHGDHDMLVRLRAAGINPVDTKMRSRGTYYPDKMPAILGCDGAGIVEAVGTAVTRFKTGDEVFFYNGGMGGIPGTYAEYTVVDERFAALKPANIGFEEAAAAPLVLITAWESLHDRACLRDSPQILIHAGAGGVGHVAIQLAKIADAEVATTVSSASKARFVEDLGADLVINYRETDFVEAIMEWTHGRGVDMALDTVGGETLERTFRAIRFYGDLVTLLQPTVDTDWKVARLRNLRLSQELMLSPEYFGLLDARVHQGHILDTCSTLMGAGKLKISLHRSFPLAEAADAHRMLEAGGFNGKLALSID
jgi:NADPH2:quinone reductase